MATAIVKLEFNPGDDIKGAFTEAIRIAKQLNCYAEFNFNGVICLARPEGFVDEGVAMYRRELKSLSKDPVAVT